MIPVDLKAIDARDINRRRVRIGDVVRRPTHFSERLKTKVQSRVGCILEAFKHSQDGPVLLKVRLDRDNGAAGLAVFALDAVKRSQAKVRGVTAEDWYDAKRSSRKGK